jgi:hypothetical protein
MEIQIEGVFREALVREKTVELHFELLDAATTPAAEARIRAERGRTQPITIERFTVHGEMAQMTPLIGDKKLLAVAAERPIPLGMLRLIGRRVKICFGSAGDALNTDGQDAQDAGGTEDAKAREAESGRV